MLSFKLLIYIHISILLGKDYLTQRFTNAYHSPSTAYNAPTKEEKEFQSLEEVKKEYDRQRKSSVVNQVSDKLGQYMLKVLTVLITPFSYTHSFTC